MQSRPFVVIPLVNVQLLLPRAILVKIRRQEQLDLVQIPLGRGRNEIGRFVGTARGGPLFTQVLNDGRVAVAVGAVK